MFKFKLSKLYNLFMNEMIDTVVFIYLGYKEARMKTSISSEAFYSITDRKTDNIFIE